LENRRAEQVLMGRISTSERREEVGKGYGRVNVVQILCMLWKNDNVETVPGWEEGRIKENGGGSEFKYGIFDMLEELL
jgi:hypothetical protein